MESVGVGFADSVEQYIAAYSGHTRLRRLMFIARNGPRQREEAVRLLISQLKHGINTSLYTQLYKELDVAMEVEPRDDNWVAATERAAATRIDTLEQELNAARSMISKEGIRKAQSNIGDYYYERGSLEDAMKAYSRCRDYCSMPWQLEEMCDSLFNVSADSDEFSMVGYPPHSKITPDDTISNRAFGMERRQIASALVSLRQKDYRSAARSFLDLQKFGEDVFPSVMSCADIAVYGSTLAVATLKREELGLIISGDHPFRQYIDTVPFVRSFITDFLESKYSSVISSCKILEDQFQLDIIFSKHIAAVISLITDKLILQYVEPYEALDINKLAERLNFPLQDAVKQLYDLIENKKIDAVLDIVSMTLRRRKEDLKAKTFNHVISTTDEHSVIARRALFRMSMMENGITVDKGDIDIV